MFKELKQFSKALDVIGIELSACYGSENDASVLYLDDSDLVGSDMRVFIVNEWYGQGMYSKGLWCLFNGDVIDIKECPGVVNPKNGCYVIDDDPYAYKSVETFLVPAEIEVVYVDQSFSNNEIHLFFEQDVSKSMFEKAIGRFDSHGFDVLKTQKRLPSVSCEQYKAFKSELKPQLENIVQKLMASRLDISRDHRLLTDLGLFELHEIEEPELSEQGSDIRIYSVFTAGGDSCGTYVIKRSGTKHVNGEHLCFVTSSCNREDFYKDCWSGELEQAEREVVAFLYDRYISGNFSVQDIMGEVV